MLAMIARERGRDDEAQMLVEDAMDLTDASQDALLAAQLRKERGEIARMQGDLGEARRYLMEAKDIYRRIGASAQVTALDKTIGALPIR